MGYGSACLNRRFDLSTIDDPRPGPSEVRPVIRGVRHMPSFDVVSEVDMHEVTNAVDQANREVRTKPLG